MKNDKEKEEGDKVEARLIISRDAINHVSTND